MANYETPGLIATAISRGDRQAEVELYRRYRQGILFLLERKTGDAELARDLCHEAFCILIQRLRTHPLEDPDKVIGFLHSVAVNLHIAEYRKVRRRGTIVDHDVVVEVLDPAEDQLGRLLRERSDRAVQETIASMRHGRDRKLLHGFYIQEKDKEEICAELQLSLRHFDKVLYRAKQRFKELIMRRDA
jgi:RNA polymerase sigma-70 factor (ECF subfamily)